MYRFLILSRVVLGFSHFCIVFFSNIAGFLHGHPDNLKLDVGEESVLRLGEGGVEGLRNTMTAIRLAGHARLHDVACKWVEQVANYYLTHIVNLILFGIVIWTFRHAITALFKPYNYICCHFDLPVLEIRYST